MGAGHSHALYLPGTSPLHRARPQCKLAAGLLFVLAVVATPREAFWAYGVYALLLAALARAAAIPLPTLARRLVIELPFLLFALFLPLVGQGERVEVLGMSLAREGLWAAWNIVAKGTLDEVRAGAGGSLEDVFLKLVSADLRREDLSWIG